MVAANRPNPQGKPAGAKPRLIAAGLGAAPLFVLLLLAAACQSAVALEPTTPLANLNRQSWVMENGLPQNTVQALAQTSDGFLWLGTEVGLVRFDGSGFTLFDEHSKPALPGSDVQCLLAAKDGSLWVGTSDGLARLKDGAVTTFTTANGLPGNQILTLGEDSDQRILLWTDKGIAQIQGERFVAIRNVDAWPATAVPSSGETPGQFSFEEQLPGNLFVTGDRSSLLIHKAGNSSGSSTGLTVGKELPGTRIQTVFADREGALWIGANGGLVRYADGKLDKLPITDPLASASVLTIFEDREGNLWVGTESNGLQILRDQRFQTLTTRDGLASDNTTAVVEDAAGTLWVGTAGNGVTALKPGTATPARTYSVRNGLPSDVILSLAAAADGDLWVGTPDGLGRIRRGSISAFTSADGLPDDFIRSLHADADGSLWIGTRRGLTHWTKPGDLAPASMQTYTMANGLGSDMVGAMARDGQNGLGGDLWIATFAGLSRLHDGKLQNFTTADGLSSNVITAILARPDGALLIGTQDHGWNVFDGKRFLPVAQNTLGHTTIHAILEDGLNHLWFATGTGLARCDCGSAIGPMQGADCAHWLEFGTADGLRSRETATNSHPSAWRAQDGRLWFATPKGLVEVDPAHFPVNTVPPPVVVERFAVDDAEQPLHATDLRIPAGHNHFQMEYAGLSFVAPQKVRYRYKLDGFDPDWTDAGGRRTAYYTNIPPGHYTFRVQAANNDGVWNEQGAALAFELRPHFYQTAWFYVLLALGLIGLIFLALRLRLLRAEREFRAVLGERTRIAREIHDTLAQGYVGVSLQLEVLSELLRHHKVDAAEEHLGFTRGYVREGLAEARQSIWALRSQDSAESILPVRMRRLVEQNGGHGLDAQFSIYGAYRPLPPGTENEILRVAQEALHNVKKHAGATSVKVRLEYITGEIVLEIRDDGRGFAASGNDARLDSPPGHYGLTGMRERAAAIGGTLEVTSAPGAGTIVRLRAPAPGKTHRPKDAAVAPDAAIPPDAAIAHETKEQS
ncbi:MAG TPA: two-component regulator propeller domain-containing protein [Terracidiphilus sp.]|jgi:signal transduction histidine kinase/ligand-binding sensor domain-containing protein|nr:two-component regulator propeller domain-containing protein [Terracidiphilus sp.]